jgi:hypothetical protein
MFTITDIPNKGKALVATQPIPVGTRILSETPDPSETARLINHSCIPNAYRALNKDTNQMTLHAITDIKPNEEITFWYITAGPRKWRQKELRQKFQFDCKCALCSLPNSKVKASDRAIKEILEINCELTAGVDTQQQPSVYLKMAKRILKLIEEENMMNLLGIKAYMDAFGVCALYGDEARAGVFVGRAADIYAVRGGRSG